MPKLQLVKKKGFTLVELSIVMVVIGLLIGGILAAQSMISTAELVRFLKTTAEYDAAVANYETRFGQLPGDSRITGNAAGNNDGKIDNGAGETFTGEIAKFWSDMSAIGVMAGNGAPYLDESAGSGSYYNNFSSANMPQAKPSKTYGLSLTFLSSAFYIPYGKEAGKNYFIIGAPYAGGVGNSNTALFSAQSGLLPSFARAIDIKIDDGKGNAGNVLADAVARPTLSNILDIPRSGSSTCAANAAGTYRLNDNSGPVCILAIRFGAQSDFLR